MIGRVIEVASEGCHLARHRGFMVIKRDGEEIGRTPLDDIAVVVASAHGLTYSNALLVELSNRNVFVVLCGSNFLPVAWVWPMVGHHAQLENMRNQIAASTPLKKRIWQALVRAKIAQQGAVLEQLGKPNARLEQYARSVKSGDSTNVEAQAARYYWPRVFGDDFRRDHKEGGTNALLNYGYTVLRSAVARAVVAAGLHPTLAVHHSNRSNAFALADDVLEVFRPHVDLAVLRLQEGGHEAVDPATKTVLANLLNHDLVTQQGTTPIQTSCGRVAVSLAQSFAQGRCELDLPIAPHPLEVPGPT
jgi:CRISPR-associated protein Cas1